MMESANWIRLEFPSNTQNVAFARTALALFAAQLDWTLEEIEDIKVAVSEAVSNAVIHGYGSQEGLISVQAAYKDDVLTVTIEDFGCGIADLEQARETGYSSLPKERMGLGFTFMHEYMDELKVHSELHKGTRVTMLKKVCGPGV